MALQDHVRNLAAVPALRELEPDALRLIAFSAETRILRAGDVLFRRNEPSDGGYVVLTGSIALVEADGGPATIVRPPALIGETALIAETARPATAAAHEPSSVLKISRALFLRVLEEHPESTARLRQAAVARLLATQRDLDGLRSRLAE